MCTITIKLMVPATSTTNFKLFNSDFTNLVMNMADDDPKYVGNDFVEEDETVVDEEKKALEGLYDLVLPPGLPHKVIMEARDKFNLEVTTRKCALKTMDIEAENLLVLRGPLDDVNNAHDYIYKKLSVKYNYKK
jgi:hypothetical protein